MSNGEALISCFDLCPCGNPCWLWERQHATLLHGSLGIIPMACIVPWGPSPWHVAPWCHVKSEQACRQHAGSLSIGLADTGCFTGDTKVVIRESDTPIAIKDMQIGQHVQCVDSGADLTNPASVKWCEVMNWVSDCCSCISPVAMPQVLTFACLSLTAQCIGECMEHQVEHPNHDDCTLGHAGPCGSQDAAGSAPDLHSG
jgi:hypothetical protein